MIDITRRHDMPTRHAQASALAKTRVERWYADLMSDRRLACEYDGGRWRIALDGRCLADDDSFECAIHAAYAMARALSALNRTHAT
jgi:hypothetical protein